MNKHYFAIIALMSGLLSTAAFAATGEYWEVTSNMEMPGMPFAMPPTTQKVCIAKDKQKDPAKTSGDKDCKVTDVKTVGNKTTWKARCDHNGEITTGSGEQINTANAYHGKVKLNGQGMNMTMSYSGKRIGGSCDTQEQTKKAQAKVNETIAQVCDTSYSHSTADRISAAELILQPGAACASQRKEFCDAVRKDAPRDATTYNALLMHDQKMQTGISIAKECHLNMAAITRSVCKTLNGDNYNDLSASCPAEAKKYREVQRRKDCEGRAYTAETRAADIRRCMSGKDDSSDGGTAAQQSGSGSSGSNPASEALEAAKKLKARFGF
jgi:Protein of unknown function (DUF3617)